MCYQWGALNNINNIIHVFVHKYLYCIRHLGRREMYAYNGVAKKGELNLHLKSQWIISNTEKKKKLYIYLI